ncbi:MAG TPA: TonB-dependent receptor plug domain-containing protein, partial [Saprospiraceae bacterium]|nr:TonB-dependent receptor plug domain-containing protein [Saprospiraceae bacterium]
MKITITYLLLLIAGIVTGQGVYTSKVMDSNNEAVVGATVNENGTDHYAFTNDEGVFVLETGSKDFKITITSIGLSVMEVSVEDGKLPALIILEGSSVKLDEVVVTALGIQRERQSLSSAVAKIDSKALTDVPLTNVVNSLAGQVAGVQITNGSSGVGSSARIIIRGENSLSGNNQPLFVVDGVPISNDLVASDLINDGGNMQEVDFGNGSAELSPDDMASISVLKGPGSAAIYGTRAANGVILITTKRGRQKKGLGISTSNSMTFDKLLTLPDYQDVYGGGSNGIYSFQNGTGAGMNDGGISSYGPKLDEGLLVKQFDSPSVGANGSMVRGGDVIARTLAN